MQKAANQITIPGLSFWKIFRFVFVIFSLYLLRDAFYRWDGFVFHSSFAGFIPSVALVTIVWSMVAVLTSLFLWLLLRGFEWFCRCIGWKTGSEFLLMFAAIFLLLIVGVMIGKTLITRELLATGLKVIIVLLVFFAAIALTWRFRNNVNIVHERITPLVWLFGIWLIVSFPIVIYHTWIKEPNHPLSQRVINPSPEDKKRPNIILVSYDAMTARDMSAFGYNRDTTPYIGEWAKNAHLFNRFQSASNWTASATASMMTGKRVWTHRMFQGDSSLFKSETESLPFILKNHGYYNVAFVANNYAAVKKLGISGSFDVAPHRSELSGGDTFIGYEVGTIDAVFFRLFADRIKYFTWSITQNFILGEVLRDIFLYPAVISKTEIPPELAFNEFLKVVDNGIPEPFFAWIHLLPPHDPYLPGAPYTGMFSDSQKLRIFSKRMVEEVVAHKVKNDEDWKVYRARYDEFIKYCDKSFENFTGELSKRKQLEDAVVILTSDHGESFEHNYFTHNTRHHYEQVTHVPLIIKEPEKSGGVVVDDLTGQIDLPPTILDLADIPIPSWMEGRSLLPFLRGEKLPPKHVYSMSFQNNPSTGGRITKGTIAVWEGDYKLIYYLEENKSLFFNLKDDPDELKNLFDEEKEIGQRLLALIQDKLKKANEKIEFVE